jgi:hypothetical protein
VAEVAHDKRDWTSLFIGLPLLWQSLALPWPFALLWLLLPFIFLLRGRCSRFPRLPGPARDSSRELKCLVLLPSALLRGFDHNWLRSPRLLGALLLHCGLGLELVLLLGFGGGLPRRSALLLGFDVLRAGAALLLRGGGSRSTISWSMTWFGRCSPLSAVWMAASDSRRTRGLPTWKTYS